MKQEILNVNLKTKRLRLGLVQGKKNIKAKSIITLNSQTKT